MIFTRRDLIKIEKNTYYNNHTENYIFIAEKIKSKLAKDFKKILSNQEKTGYLNEKNSKKRYELYRKLMRELKRKHPEEYQKVYSRL